ncbi:MAG: flagellar hook-length control protein FliK [Ghiorsea sp.]|nr:flagellar hook-length control protein FliK [Ghiorsea sp.]
MINTNNISTEASAGSISKGKQQGNKASKALFSTLLGMLQKGASKDTAKQTVQQGSHKNTVLSTSEGKNQALTNQQGNKNLQHILSQTSNTKNIDKKITHILQQTKSADVTDKKSVTNKNSQHSLTQTSVAQVPNKNLQHTLAQTSNIQAVDKNVQYILAQADKPQITGKTQTTDKNVPSALTEDMSVDARDAIASIQEAQVTPLIPNTSKSSVTINEQQVKQQNRSASQATTQNISPELLAEASNKKGKATQLTDQQNTERFASNIQNLQQNKINNQQLTTQQSKQIEQQVSTQQTNKVTNGSEQVSDGIKTSQAAIAAIQQRTGSQTQQSQSNNSSAVAAANSPSAIRMASADNSSTSQQDLNSNQRDVDMSLLDTAKADNKNAKGLDFQAQLAYKSQRTFTPADTMLEIVKSAKTGNTTLELQLEPANLGKVQVSIQIDQAKHIQVVFTVDQAAAKQALDQQMPQLRLAMAQQGLDLSGFSMQMNQQGGQQQGGNQQASNRATTDNALDATTLAQSNVEQNTRIGVNLATHGHLSILA